MLDLGSVKALAFDVFGTVVDWRRSIIREGEALGRARWSTWPSAPGFRGTPFSAPR